MEGGGWDIPGPPPQAEGPTKLPRRELRLRDAHWVPGCEHISYGDRFIEHTAHRNVGWLRSRLKQLQGGSGTLGPAVGTRS